ncbi:MAG: phospholipase D-like domain-containing protein [Myxococcales bacterium]|nr:phospholipase D-like domain-containing protein [Myxococcales bacterium]
MALRNQSLSLISGRAHYDEVVAAVLAARSSVWIATANLKELLIEDGNAVPGRRRARGRPSYRSVLEPMAELAARGVELRILHAALPSRAFRDAFDGLPALVRGGLELRACGRVHLKTVIVDGGFAYVGSANWTGAGMGVKRSERRNFELGVITRDEAMLDAVQALYDHIWQGAACATCGLRKKCEAPIA